MSARGGAVFPLVWTHRVSACVRASVPQKKREAPPTTRVLQ